MEIDTFDMMAESAIWPWVDGPGEEVEELLEDDPFSDEDPEAEEDPERADWANGWGSDGDVDADALASAGFGTDEDYGCYGYDE